MNLHVAQVAALVCHANASLSGRDIGPFFPGNSTCMACEQVTFILPEEFSPRALDELEVVGTPNEWFAFLRASGARGVRLVHVPSGDPKFADRTTVAFGGGGLWALEVVYDGDRSECWSARWKWWNRTAEDNRIWRVSYSRLEMEAKPVGTLASLTDIAGRLNKSLREIHDFAERCQVGFTQSFANALSTLDSKGRRRHGPITDFAPHGFLSAQATIILDAVQPAWVFGAMGSWNDVTVDDADSAEYEKVSEQLYQALVEAVVTAANSTYKECNA